MRLLFVLIMLSVPGICQAELKMSSVFGDHMVLQQKAPVRIWGWTKPGQSVSVSLADKSGVTTADGDGRFELSLEPVEVGGPYTLAVKADETREFQDVLVGEVWLCSGQSNMQWPVASSNDADLEILTANYPQIRLITVPQVGTQEPQNDFNGAWAACTPETVRDFSAVGYYFGRQLHQTLNVPIGLIDNSWGGSACEAWVRRDLLEKDEKYAPLLERWAQIERTSDYEADLAAYRKRLEQWNVDKKGNRPAPPRDQLKGQHRPANLYNGVLKPILGYTIQGAIWYQGESNAGRAYQYRDLFPLMIQSWRDEWRQGDFPFYWVQLADFKSETDTPGDSDWAELREAQTMTMSRLPNTGEAVILNLGEAADIHPMNKQDVALRLSRWALANEYDLSLVFRSPLYREMKVADGRVLLDFDHVGGGLDTFDVREPLGFAIAGEDQKFVTAEARIVDNDTIEVWSKDVAAPVAVRYAWADNPVCNVQNRNGLPLTPFRTDDWPGVTAEAK
ncbi:MAG: sialate O-acetylesterase [Planctomycetaceae bacterium]|nr:sialate O-acetylesterase [Planctomycetaceae bacterium]